MVSFILGMTVANEIKQGKHINSIALMVVFVVMWVVCRLLGLSSYWCIAVILIIISVFIIDALQGIEGLFKFLTMMGVLSLEMYLANGYIRYAFIDSPLYSLDVKLFYGHYFDYFIIFLMSIILSLGVNHYARKISQK
jgi:hypothetical protein